MKENAIEYFKFHRKIFCDDYLKICPKDSIAYQATLKEKEFYDMAIKALEQEPRKGHWLHRPHVYGVAYCSICDFELKIDNTNYCPNCGADMREVEE